MNKKFIKKNIFMIVFMSLSLIAVVALLIMVYFEHASMKKYDAQKKDLLKKIKKIFKQKYAPVKVNVNHIESDAEAFNKESQKVERMFGQPYNPALQRFAETVAIPLDEFKAKFGEFWEMQKDRTTRDLIFRRYKVRQFSEDFPKHRSTWAEAMNAFMKEAQKVTLEEIDASNVDGIFLAAMGKGRRFSDSPQRCLAFMKRMRYKMIDYFDKKKINCADTNFSFDDSREPALSDIAAIARAWEIVSDLTKRIADAKINPKEDFLELVEFSKRGLDGEVDGSYTLYRFDFTVNADIASIRRIIKKLYEAYKVNRIYAIRDIKLTRTVDNVSNILAESEAIEDELDYDSEGQDKKNLKPEAGSLATRRFDLPRPGSSPNIPTNVRKPARTLTAKPKPAAKEKKKILGPKDPGYAKTIIGDKNIIRAEFQVDYIVFDDSPK